jgi:hypothetical protein
MWWWKEESRGHSRPGGFTAFTGYQKLEPNKPFLGGWLRTSLALLHPRRSCLLIPEYVPLPSEYLKAPRYPTLVLL